MAKHYTFGWKITKAVLNKTDGRCYYCGDILPDDTRYYDERGNIVSSVRNWDVDHKLPLAKGGNHNLSNLVPACKTCNNIKRDMSPDEFMGTKYIEQKLGWDPL